MEANPKLSKLRTQLEYYLSDKNLSKDAFFHGKMSENGDHYLNFEFIENCNAIKRLGVTRAELIEAAKESPEIELNEAQDSIRRAGNKLLPELKVAEKKAKAEGEKKENGAKPAGDLKDDEMEPLILFIRDVASLYKKGRTLEEEVGAKFSISVPFARIGKSDDGGQILLDKRATPDTVVETLLKDGFEFEGKKVKFDVGTDKDRQRFMRDHKQHVNRIIKRKFGKVIGKPRRDQKKRWSGAVTFEDVKYPTLEAFKSRFKGLIMKTKNGEDIPEDGATLLKNLLKHHPKSEEKLKDLQSVTVDFHPDHNMTRCFFVKKTDGTKEDFSYHKCIQNFINSQIEKTEE